MNRHSPSSNKRASGVSLIEVLIALLVFSIGLQGIASLQYQSVKENFDSTQRTHGVWVAQELISRIQANPDGWSSYVTDPNTDPNAAPDPASNTWSEEDCDTPPNPFCADGDPGDGLADDCTAAQMAAFDLWDAVCLTPANNPVQKPLTNLLVKVESLSNANYRLTLQWDSKAVSDDTQDFTDTARDAQKPQLLQRVFRP